MPAPLYPQSARQQGFTYLGLLFFIALMGVTLALTGVVWHTAQKREKERELLFVGNQFRQAIAAYYNSPGRVKQFPKELDELLKDPRQLATTRYLRQVYRDPFTGKANWGLIKSRDDRIMGVYSLSEDEPIKQSNFREADKELEGKMRYMDWRFVYNAPLIPAQSVAAPVPILVPVTPVAAPLLPVKQSAEAVSPAKPSEPKPVAPKAAEPKPFDESECDILLKNDMAACQSSILHNGEISAMRCAESAGERSNECREKQAVTGLSPLIMQINPDNVPAQ